ncbi:hypothetical protein [Mycolicibacterium conceptionense]|uniref:hypothetical protein n=1 Tax=Mycolicibacterium conceptionense TaxID=451644 RepID=UPI00096EE5E7|nr:hypothetical protein [Mycolicibacterium conceptionense]OMB79286.1 hypothetical protein A5743_14395 [Mycolicibacterium conceptionense]
MPRTTTDGKPLKLVLSYELGETVVDTQIGAALGKPAATYSRRKDAADFPTFEELERVGTHFGINPRWLHVRFGYIGLDELRTEPSVFI